MPKTFYITTAIDYPNGQPHIGHAYEKIVSDFYARWHRQCGKSVHFLTGTDENGQKLIKAAQQENLPTLDYVNQQVEHFRALCKQLNISHDDFIRTTEPRHHQECQKLWSLLSEKNQIYCGQYCGQYCYECESFYPPSQAPQGHCPHHQRPLEEKREQGLFFRLGDYQEWLIAHLQQNPGFISPDKARKEILSRLTGEKLKDLAISRPNEVGWGVPVPGHQKFVMYTWFDAVINYYSALSQAQKTLFWPANCHVIGKDIIWFHTVIWPAILHACELPLPRKIYVHGMVLAADGQKMSKTLGNTIDPREMATRYPVDSFRYYMLRAISATDDGKFCERDLQERHNTELGDDFGNLVFRVIKFALARLSPTLSCQSATQELFFDTMAQKFTQHVECYEHNLALDALWESIRGTNQYLNQTAPWKVKDDPQRLHAILYNCLHALEVFAFYLTPIMPGQIAKLQQFLGVELSQNPVGQFGRTTFRLQTPQMLFAKFQLPAQPRG